MVATFNPSWRGIVEALRLAVIAAGGVPSVSVYPANWGGAIQAIDDLRASLTATTLDGHVAAANPHSQYATDTDLTGHTSLTNNPHTTTAAQVGAVAVTLVGAANGVATLDGATKLTQSQLPLGTTGATAAAGNDARFTNASNHIAASQDVHSLGSGIYVLGNKLVAGQYIQQGQVTASGSAIAQAFAEYREIAVVFPAAFSAAPKVFVTCTTGYPSAATNVTTVGFTARVFGETSFGNANVIHYLAIGA